MNEIEIIAHRGASDTAPENTVAAFKKAWEEEADALEVDVRLSKDGRLVVIHDATLWRTGSGREWQVAKKTLDELKKVDVGIWKDPIPLWSGEKIPTLLETLKIIPKGKRLFIEIKCEEDVMLPLEKDIAESGISSDQIIITSFQLPVVREIKKLNLSAVWVRGISKYYEEENGPVFETDDPKKLKALQRSFMIKQCKEAGALGFSCKADMLNADIVEEIRQYDMKLYAWTINSMEDFNKVISLGVNGIITDCPGEMRKKIKLSKLH